MWPWEQPVSVVGGTAAQQAEVSAAFALVLSTPRGQQLEAQIRGPWYWHGDPKTLHINCDKNDSAEVATLGVGTLLDWYSYANGNISGAHFSANLGVGVYGMLGGIFTAVPAAAYYGLDNFYPGGVAGALTDRGNMINRMMQYDPAANIIW